MSSAGIVSLLKLLQAQLDKDPSRWTLAYKNLISRQKEARSGEQMSPARWNGVAYGALLSTWRAKGLAQRADALDIGLERLSQFNGSGLPTEEILRLILLVADVEPTTDLPPRSTYGSNESDVTIGPARQVVLHNRSFTEQLLRLASPVVLPELPTIVEDSSIALALPTQSAFFHLPSTSVHELVPLSSPLSPDAVATAAIITRTDSSAFISAVRGSLASTVWEQAASTEAPPRIDWSTLAGNASTAPLWHTFASLAPSVAQFEQLYATYSSDDLARKCVTSLSEATRTESLILALTGTSSPLITCDKNTCALNASRIRVPGVSYTTGTSLCNLILSYANRAAFLRRWADESADPKAVGSVGYAVGRLVHRLMTQFASYVINFRASGGTQTSLSLHHYLSPTLPMLHKLTALLQSSPSSGIRLIDALYSNCSGGLFGRTEATPLVALSYELAHVAVQPLLAFVDALVTNCDVSLAMVDPAREFHVAASDVNDQRLLQVLRLLRAIGVAPPEVPTFASALPDYAADAPIEALLRVHVTDPLLAVVRVAETKLLASLRSQHNLDAHLDALPLFLLSEVGTLPAALLKAAASVALTRSAERVLQSVLLDCALDAHPCARYLALHFGPEMLAPSVLMPRLAYRPPDLMRMAISDAALSRYGSIAAFLLEMRWHASLVQQAVTGNAKAVRSEEEGRRDGALGFALMHIHHAFMSYAMQEIARFRARWATQRAAASTVSQLDASHLQCLDALLDALFLAPRAAPVRTLFTEFFTQAREYHERRVQPQAFAALQRRRRLLRLVLLKLDARSTGADVTSLALALS